MLLELLYIFTLFPRDRRVMWNRSLEPYLNANINTCIKQQLPVDAALVSTHHKLLPFPCFLAKDGCSLDKARALLSDYSSPTPLIIPLHESNVNDKHSRQANENTSDKISFIGSDASHVFTLSPSRLPDPKQTLFDLVGRQHLVSLLSDSSTSFSLRYSTEYMLLQEVPSHNLFTFASRMPSSFP